jgi:hypothetical protein
VIGQLHKPSDSKPDVPLSSAQICVGQEGGGAQADSQLQFTATPDREGNFCIDDVPPGNYFFYVVIRSMPGNGIHPRRITVPTVNEKLWQRPVDLGVLTLEPMNRRPAQAVKALR